MQPASPHHQRACRPCSAAGLAAVLPCFVVYLEVGKALKKLGAQGQEAAWLLWWW